MIAGAAQLNETLSGEIFQAPDGERRAAALQLALHIGGKSCKNAPQNESMFLSNCKNYFRIA